MVFSEKSTWSFKMGYNFLINIYSILTRNDNNYWQRSFGVIETEEKKQIIHHRKTPVAVGKCSEFFFHSSDTIQFCDRFEQSIWWNIRAKQTNQTKLMFSCRQSTWYRIYFKLHLWNWMQLLRFAFIHL